MIDNMTPDIEMSLAIVLRSVLEHTEPDSPLGWHAEMVEKWLRARMVQQGMLPAKEEQVVHD